MTASSTNSINRSSLLRAETMSNADLYCVTPPAYAMSAAEDEQTLDAEAVDDSKTGIPGPSNFQESLHIPEDEPRTLAPSTPNTLSPVPTELPPVYFQELAMNASTAHVRKCTLLPKRPAVWLVKKRNLALSPLAAEVLIKEGLIRSKDLDLISQSAGVKRDPSDPMSAIAFATYDTVGDVLLGLVEGPVEAYRQFGIADVERKRRLEEASPSHGNSSPALSSNAYKQVAISTGKGFGRIVGAGVKAPMTFTHNLTRGFHNAPKLYGDEVREYENVTDIRSGIKVSAKGFGYGVYDGISGFFIQPLQGARKDGASGFAKGFGKGIGGMVCKPAAGICGIVGYTSAGVYREIQGLRPGGNRSVTEAFKSQGEVEYSQAPDQTRVEVVKRWCQVTMRQGHS
ncbi:uncharacterized protein BDR25DRAFT_366188 [Lindgomyces ingoldianus]|uniref:Uncharacterized protein n=1 Tax=Lindgomyces ingoldianus TaxID=673940 RepID=A0ACB6R1E1_9PLEO|nr:uncharacterized protein BDR25DRAFT_366188 [Lindgomyces ingoldianus]KAF2472961.1 hypothetical protein BDR25DRAFT_366188 [Lindgomyces ingoldianus]